METRITKKEGYDIDTHYVIEELVDSQGHYIVWPGIYTTEEKAQEAIDAQSK